MTPSPSVEPHAPSAITASALKLGYAGLLPQALAVALAFADDRWRWTAVAFGFGYAALIFSFLGGVWWGLALTRRDPPGWIFGVAVLPSLIAAGAYVPWIFGLAWPQPSLILLALLILLSPLVDRAILRDARGWHDARGFDATGWMRLRTWLSLGLGSATMLLSLRA